MQLQGKTAVVTGGGTGIGLGGAIALAELGCKDIIGGRREEKLREAAATFTGQPALATHQLDVTSRDSVAAFFDFASKTLGDIHILVNSAGVNIRTRSMAEMQPSQWDQVLAVNATGAYNCMAAALPAMRARGDGLIINISSVAGKRALELGGVAYCASKFAMTALGTCVNNEAASDGVRVTSIYPGEVNTPILENRPAPVSDERKAAMLQPADVGAMIAAIALLPPRANVAEMVIKPTVQDYC